MSDGRDKNIAPEEYFSQPQKHSTSWILKKWRRPKEPEITREREFVTNRQSLHGHIIGKWAIPDDENDNWATDVVDFYNKGDAPFCYSAVFSRRIELDKNFWGILLGYRSNGYLTPTVKTKTLIYYF